MSEPKQELRCPACGVGGLVGVTDSRRYRDRVRRRRTCDACGERFTTYEVVLLESENPNWHRQRNALQARVSLLAESATEWKDHDWQAANWRDLVTYP